jgi:hypothetical protein
MSATTILNKIKKVKWGTAKKQENNINLKILLANIPTLVPKVKKKFHLNAFIANKFFLLM